MSVGLENGKSDNENEIIIKESPSIIISQTLEKSFSDSSIQSYKKYTDLLSLKEENKSSEKIINSLYFNKLKTNSKMLFNHNLNFKGVIQNSNKEINNNNNIIQKIQELNDNIISKNQNRFFNNKIILFKSPNKSQTQLMSKMENIKNKIGALKVFFGDNNNTLQKKEKKLLAGFISNKFKEEDDIEEFKNQFEIRNRSPFGCLDFQRKFKTSFNVSK
jgi:hypothetical protein